MAYYAVWMKPANQELAPVYLEAHIEYLSQLRLEGKVSGNGRLLNGPAGGGLVIYRGNSIEEVQALIEKDPFVVHGVRAYEFYHWDVRWAPHTGLGGIREITAAHLQERIENGEKLTIIDVREDHEVAEGTIPGAIHIRLGDLEHRHTEIQPAGELFFVCRGGRRSLKACEWLLSNDYTGLVNVAGGMTAWKELR
jgi:rhodanese-related sulfurtransferase/uncharacterized protein YciI